MNDHSFFFSQFWRRTIALSLVIVHFYFSTVGAVDWGSLMRGRKLREDQEKSGYLSPGVIKEKSAKQENIIKQKEKLEKGRDRGQEKVRNKVDGRKAITESKKQAEELISEIDQARRKREGIVGQNSEFNYVKYDDGRTVYFQDNLVSRIEDEKIYDPQGNFKLRRTFGMEYNRKRLMNKYQSETMDWFGNEEKVEWSGGEYTSGSVYYADDETSAEKLLTAYEQKTTDAFGNEQTVNWHDAKYNPERLVVSYQEEETDIFGNQSRKAWSDARYDANKQLVSYREESIDKRGNKSIRIWSGGEYVKNSRYDENKRDGRGEYLLVGYHEEVTDSLGNQTSRDWQGAEYNEYDQLVKYQEKVTDALASEQVVNWQKGSYDQYGRLTGYYEEKEDSRGNLSIVDWSNGVYNRYGQLLNYREVKIDALGNREESQWSGGTYNSRKQLTGYAEKQLDRFGNESHLKWSGGEYNRLGDLVKYSEESVDILGNSGIKEWSGGVYDRYGQLSGYTEQTTDSLNNLRLVSRQGIAYDRYGRVVEYQEAENDQLGQDWTRYWEQGKYDRYGQLVSYQEKETDSRGQDSLREWSGGQYNRYGQLVKYQEAETDGLGNIRRRDWGNGEYDCYGRLLSYEERDENEYGVTSRLVWSAGEYNRYQQLIKYRETVEENGMLSRREWTQGVCDRYGRLAGYQEERLDGEGNKLEALDWRALEYNRYGQLLARQEKRIDLLGNKAVINWHDGQYNQYGDVVSYREETEDGFGGALSRIWSGGEYDCYGRVAAYHEERVSNLNPGITIKTELSGQSYDRYGQEAGYLKVERTSGWTADGRQVNLVTESKRSGGVIKDNILLGYQEQIIKTGCDLSGEEVSLIEDIEVSGAVYQVYTEKSHKVGKSLEQLPPNWVSMSSEQKEHYLDGAVLNLNGESIVWSELDAEEQDKLLNGEQISWQGRVFSLEGSKREIKLDLRSRRERLETVYGARGQAAGYREKIWSEDTSASETLATMSKIIYNSLGAMIGYREERRDGQGVTTRSERSGIGYNSLGQMIAYREESKKEGEGVRQISAQWPAMSVAEQKEYLAGFTLNLSGEAIKWDDLSVEEQERFLAGEEVVLFDGSVIVFDPEKAQVRINLEIEQKVERKDLRYDVLERVVGYQEEISGAQTALTTTVNWRSGGYNALGQTVGELRSEDYRGKNYVLRKETERNAIVYNRLGQTVGYRELSKDSGSPETTVDREVWATTYDSLGRTARTNILEHTYGKTAVSLPADWAEKRPDGETPLWTVQEKAAYLAGVIFIVNNLEIAWSDLSAADQEAILGGEGVLIELADGSETLISLTGNGAMLIKANLDVYQEISQTEAQFDRQGYLTGYSERMLESGLDQFGNILDRETLRVRAGISYNEFNQIVSYAEQGWSSDAPNIRTSLIRDEMVYDALGQLAGYREVERTSGEAVEELILPDNWNAVDQKGNKFWSAEDQQNYLSKLTFVIAGRELGWAELSSAQQSAILAGAADGIEVRNELDLEKISTRTNMVYNENGQLLAYDEEVWDSARPGGTARLEMSGMEYNGSGQLARYREVNKDVTGVVSERQRLSADYNELGQVINYEEQILNYAYDQNKEKTLELQINNRREGIIYNAFNQLTHYREARRSSDNGLVKYTTWGAGEYNRLGQLTGYTEVEHNIGEDATGVGVDTMVERERLATSYNGFGQVAGYEETTISSDAPAITAYSTMGNMRYDSLGNLSGYLEVEHKEGKNAQGEITLDLTNKTQRYLATYNAFGQMVGYRETSERIGRDETAIILEQRSSLARSVMLYNSAGQLISYEETQLNGETSNLSTEIKWREGKYTRVGQLQSFQEQRITSGEDGEAELYLEQNTTRLSTIYNSYGQVAGYRERSSSSDAPLLETEVCRQEISYNLAGLVSGYTEEVSRQGTGTQLVWELPAPEIWGALTNDEKQKLFSGEEITVPSPYPLPQGERENKMVTIKLKSKETAIELGGAENDCRITTTRQGMKYNDLGQLINYSEESENSFNRAQSRKEWQADYYNRANQLIAYTEKNSNYGADRQQLSSGEWVETVVDETITTRQDSSCYNLLGQIIFYHKTSNSTQAPELQTETDWSGAKYNSFGQLWEYNEQEHQYSLNTNEQFDLTNTRQRRRIAYNRAGQMSSYQEVGATSGNNITTTTDWLDAAYNNFGQLSGAKTVSRKQGVDGENQFDELTTEIKTNLLYNQADQLYAETDLNISNPYISQSRQWWVTGFNNFGQVSGYIEEIKQDGRDEAAELHLQTRNERREIVYNSQQQVIGYTEESKNSQSPDLKTITSWRDGLYNQFGQIISYTQTVQETGQNLNRQTTLTRTNTVYNRLGQLASYVEELTRSDSAVKEKTIRLASQYNDLNQLKSFQQTVEQYSETDGKKIAASFIQQNRSGISYTVSGLISAYQEEVIKELTGLGNVGQGFSLANFEEISWSAGYNNFAQLVSYTRNSHVFDAAQTLDYQTVTTRQDTRYDQQGGLTAFQEETVDAYGNVSRKSEENIEYNRLGQMVSFSETNQDSDGNKTIIERQTTTYDNFGRVLGYSQQEKKSGAVELEETVVRSEMSYNSLGLALSYREQRTGKTFAGQLLYKEEFYRHDQVYTEQNQTSAYQEEVNRRIYNEQGKLEREKTVSRQWASGSQQGYNQLGQLLKYTETTSQSEKDGEGKVLLTETTTRDWQAGTSNVGQGFSLANFAVTNNPYNLYGEITAYREQTSRLATDTEGRQLEQAGQLVRSAISYYAAGETYAGKMASYIEEGTNTEEGKYQKNWSQAAYGNAGQLTGYQETGYSSAGGRYETSRQEINYDQRGRMVAYTEEGINANNGAWQKSWTQAKYNVLDQLVSYSEEGRNSAGKYNKEWQAVAADSYNVFGQQNNYQETGWTATGGKYSKEWTAAAYNELGKLLSYRQELVNSYGQNVATDWTGGNYSDLSQLLSYNQQTTISEQNKKISTTQTSWTAGAADYDREGQLLHYQENTTLADDHKTTKTEKEWTALAYEGVFLRAFQEISSTTGADENGINYVNISLKQQSELSYVGAAEAALDPEHKFNGQLQGYLEENYSSDTPDKLTARLVSEIEYDDNGLISALDSEATESLAPNSGNETFWFSGLAGQVLAMLILDTVCKIFIGDKTIRQPAGPAGDNAGKTLANHDSAHQLDPFNPTVSKVKRSQITYDEHGREKSWSEEIDYQDSGKKTFSQVEVEYDGSTQQYAGYFARLEDKTAGDIVLPKYSTLSKTDFHYDAFGRALGWDQQINNFDRRGEKVVKTTTAQVSAGYWDNTSGLMASYKEQGVETGEDEAGQRLERQYLLEKTEIGYDTLGRTINWQERRWSADTANRLETQSEINVAYDGYSRIAEYREEGSEQGQVATTDAEGKISFNEYQWGFTLFKTGLTDGQGMEYDSLGRTTAYREIRSNSEEAGVTTTAIFEDLAYDQEGNLAAFQSRSLKSGQVEQEEYFLTKKIVEVDEQTGETTTSNEEAALSVDELNNLLAANVGQTVAELIKEGKIYTKKTTVEINVLTTNSRLSTEYNQLGQVVGSRDLTMEGEIVFDPLVWAGLRAGDTADLLAEQSEVLNKELTLNVSRFSCNTAGQQSNQTSETFSYAPDGSWSVNKGILFSSYDQQGRLIAAANPGKGYSDDGYGNISTSETEQTYLIINGQAKTAESKTESQTINLDGSTAESNQTISYFYDAQGNLIKASGQVSGQNEDRYNDNVTGRGKNQAEQWYRIINNQARLVLTDSFSTGSSADKTESSTKSVTVYDYNADGEMIAANGFNRSESKDYAGNLNQTVSRQSYQIFWGRQAKIGATENETSGQYIDDSRLITLQKEKIVYDYTGTGRLKKAQTADGRAGITELKDGFGNITVVTTCQTMAIVAGQAKISVKQTNTKFTDEVNGGSKTTDLTLNYGYDQKGRLVSSSGAGEASALDSAGNSSKITLSQNYFIDSQSGQARLKNSEEVTGEFEPKGLLTQTVIRHWWADKEGADDEAVQKAYNLFGQTLHYTEEISETPAGSADTKTTTRQWWAGYDAQNKTYGTDEIYQDAYNKKGQLTGYYEYIQETGKDSSGQNIVSQSRRGVWDMQYYKQTLSLKDPDQPTVAYTYGSFKGQVSQFKEEGTNNGTAYNFAREGIQYYLEKNAGYGQLKGQIGKFTQKGKNEGNSYQFSRDQITYYLQTDPAQGWLQGQNKSYREEGRNTNQYYTTQRDEIKYYPAENLSQEDKGRIVGYHDETINTSLSPDLVTISEVSQLKYDTFGRITHSFTAVNEKNRGTISLDHRYNVEVFNNKFGLQGHVLRSERITREDLKTTTETSLSDNRYDDRGRVTYSKSEVKETGALTNGTELNHSYNLESKLMAYDENNQLLEYTRVTSADTGAADKTSTEHTINSYSKEGRIIEKLTEITETGKDYNTTRTINTFIDPGSYNGLGQLTAYSETSFEGKSLTLNVGPGFSPAIEGWGEGENIWKNLTAEARKTIVTALKDKTVEAEGLVTINDYTEVKYDTNNRLYDYQLDTKRRGTTVNSFESEYESLQAAITDKNNLLIAQNSLIDNVNTQISQMQTDLDLIKQDLAAELNNQNLAEFFSEDNPLSVTLNNDQFTDSVNSKINELIQKKTAKEKEVSDKKGELQTVQTAIADLNAQKTTNDEIIRHWSGVNGVYTLANEKVTTASDNIEIEQGKVKRIRDDEKTPVDNKVTDIDSKIKGLESMKYYKIYKGNCYKDENLQYGVTVVKNFVVDGKDIYFYETVYYWSCSPDVFKVGAKWEDLNAHIGNQKDPPYWYKISYSELDAWYKMSTKVTQEDLSKGIGLSWEYVGNKPDKLVTMAEIGAYDGYVAEQTKLEGELKTAQGLLDTAIADWELAKKELADLTPSVRTEENKGKYDTYQKYLTAEKDNPGIITELEKQTSIRDTKQQDLNAINGDLGTVDTAIQSAQEKFDNFINTNELKKSLQADKTALLSQMNDISVGYATARTDLQTVLTDKDFIIDNQTVDLDTAQAQQLLNNQSINYNGKDYTLDDFSEARIKTKLAQDQTIKRTGTDYNLLGQLTGYSESSTDKNTNLTVTTNNTDIKYNLSNQQVAVFANVSEADDTNVQQLNHTYQVSTKVIGYNTNGQISAQTKITQEGSKTTTEKMTGLTYDQQGRLSGSIAAITESSIDGSKLAHTYTQEMTNIKYDDLNQMVSYQRIKKEKDGDKKTEEDVTGLRYDGRSRLVYSQTTVKESSLGVSGNTLEHSCQLIVKDISYNDLNQQESFNRLTFDGSKTTEEKNNQSYNSQGQIAGNSIQITEYGKKDAALLYHTYHKGTIINDYNDLGQVSRQSVTITDREKLTTETSLADIGYDTAGRVIYSQNQLTEKDKKTVGTKLNHLSTVTTEITEFNRLDQVVSQTRTTVDGDKTVTEQIEGSKYNQIGQLTGSVTKVTEKDSAGKLNNNYDLTASESAYNSFGQLISSKQKITQGSSEINKTIYTAYSITGREKEIVTVKEEAGKTTTTVLTIGAGGYNSLGQMDSYTALMYKGEKILFKGVLSRWDQLADDVKQNLFSGKVKMEKEVLTINSVSNLSYNTQGQQESWVTSSRIVGTDISDYAYFSANLFSKYNDYDEDDFVELISEEIFSQYLADEKINKLYSSQQEVVNLLETGQITIKDKTYQDFIDDYLIKVFDDNFKDDNFIVDEEKIVAKDIARGQKLVLMGNDPLLCIDGREYKANQIKVASGIDAVSTTVRAKTTYNNLAQVDSSADLTFDHYFLNINKKAVSGEKILRGYSSAVENWLTTDCQIGDTLSETMFLPTQYMTISNTTDITYTPDGEMKSFVSVKKELKAVLDADNKIVDGIFAASTTKRLETVKDPNNSNRLLFIHEENINAGRETETLTFFDYGNTDNPSNILKLTKDKLSASWIAEESLLEYDAKDRVNKSVINRYHDLTAVNDTTMEKLAADFSSDVVSAEQVFKVSKPAERKLELSAYGYQDFDTTIYEYDTPEKGNRVRYSFRTHQDQAGLKTVEKTWYFYKKDDTPFVDSSITESIVNGQFDSNGVYLEKTGIKTTEYTSQMIYNDQGLLSSSEVVRQVSAQGKDLPGAVAESNIYTYQSGQIKTLTKSVYTSPKISNGANGIYTQDFSGPKSTEITIYNYTNNLVSSSQTTATDVLGRRSAINNSYTYDHGRTSSVETIRIDYYDENNSITTDIQRTNMVYHTTADAASDQTKIPGQLAGYTETITSTRNDIKVVNTVSGITYDAYGRTSNSLTHVQETDTNGLSGYAKQYQISLTITEYTANGQLAKAIKTTIEGNKRIVENMSISYDDYGRQKESSINFLEESVSDGGRSFKNTYMATNNYTYRDSKSDLLSWSKKTITDGKKSTTQEMDNISYLWDGKMSGYQTKITDKSVEDGGVSLNHTYSVYTYVGEYNSWDLVTKERKVTIDGNKKTSENTTYTYSNYANQLRISSSNTKVTETDILKEGAVFSHSYDQETKDISYNQLGQVTGQTRIITEDKKITEQKIKDIVYNTIGLQSSSLVEVSETTTSLTDKRTYSIQTKSTEYNDFGQIIAQVKVTTEGNKSTEENITGMRYNNQSQLVYSQTTFHETDVDKNGLSLNHTYTVEMDGIGYNLLGQMINYTRTTIDGELTKTESTLLVYNRQGLLLSTKSLVIEKIGAISANVSAIEHSYKQDVTVGEYNQYGQVMTQTTEIFNDNGGRDKASTVNRTGITYDGNGRVTGYKDDLISNTASKKHNYEEWSNITYNTLGQINASHQDRYDEVITKEQGVRIDISQTSYDTLGRRIFSEEKRSWTVTAGGGIEGLDSVWKNGKGAVYQYWEYYGGTNLISNIKVLAGGKGDSNFAGYEKDHWDTYSSAETDTYQNTLNGMLGRFNGADTNDKEIIGKFIADGLAGGTSFDLSKDFLLYYEQKNIQYDQFSRMTAFNTTVTQYIKYDYTYKTDGFLGIGRKTKVEPRVGLITTNSLYQISSFDSYGRERLVYTEFNQNDPNGTSGSELTGNITYNTETGRRESSSGSSQTTTEIEEDTLISDSGKQTNYRYDQYGNLDAAATERDSLIETTSAYNDRTGTMDVISTIVEAVVTVALSVCLPGAGTMLGALLSAAAQAAWQVAKAAIAGEKLYGNGALWNNVCRNFAINFVASYAGGDPGKEGGFASTKFGKWLGDTGREIFKYASIAVINYIAVKAAGGSDRQALLAAAVTLGVGLASAGIKAVSEKAQPALEPPSKPTLILTKIAGEFSKKMVIRELGKKSWGAALAEAVSGLVTNVLAGTSSVDTTANSITDALFAQAKESYLQRNMPESSLRYGQITKSVKEMGKTWEEVNEEKKQEKPQDSQVLTSHFVETVDLELASQLTSLAAKELTAPVLLKSPDAAQGVSDKLESDSPSVIIGNSESVLQNIEMKEEAISIAGGLLKKINSEKDSADLNLLTKDNKAKKENSVSSEKDTSSVLLKKNTARSALSVGQPQYSTYVSEGNQQKKESEYTRIEYGESVKLEGLDLIKTALEDKGVKILENEKLEANGFAGEKKVSNLLGVEIEKGAVAKVNDVKIGLYFDKAGNIVASQMTLANGMKELRSYNYRMKDGKVEVAYGEIAREIGGKFEVVGSWQLAYKGSKEYAEGLKRLEGFVDKNKVEAVYAEKDNSGNLTRSVYLDKDNKAVASEHRRTDGNYELLTYNYTITAEDKERGVVANGKIYTKDNEKDKYGANVAGTFEIREISSPIDGQRGLSKDGQAILKWVQGLEGSRDQGNVGQGFSLAIKRVYEEQMSDGSTREIAYQADGKTVYQTQTDKTGKKTATLFDGQGGAIKYTMTAKGADVIFTKIGKLSDQEMTGIINTAPVVDNKDSAIITNTLVQAQEAKTQAEQSQWKQQLQQMLPEMRDNKLYLKLGKYEIILANPDKQLGKDQDGNLVLTGYLLDPKTGEAGSRPVTILTANSAAGQKILQSNQGNVGQGFSLAPSQKPEYILILPQDPGLKTQDVIV
ncbi:MAG: hypothetical protein ABII74_02365, partial [Elusimicrobiota bacterium]